MTDAQLRVLAALAEAGSFTRAAKRLGMSQSAVSHALAGLEQSLGVTLVRRSGQGMQLTEIGERTAERARRLARIREEIREDAEAARRLQRGTLRVGSFGVSASRRLLPPMLEAFAERYPGIDVLVTEGTDDEVQGWLADGTVDVGFVTLPNDEFDTVAVAEDDMVVLLPAGHPLAAAPRVPVDRLAGQPFIMSTAGCEPLVRETAGGVALDVRYRIRDVDTIAGMVQRGLGVAIKPSLALPEPLPAGVVARPVDPPRIRRVGLAVRRRDVAPLPCRAFLKVAGGLAARPPRSRRA